MSDLEFRTAKRRKDPITFDLDDEKFTFIPPKSAVMVLPIVEGGGTDQEVVKATFDWLGSGLTEWDREQSLKAAVVGENGEPGSALAIPEGEAGPQVMKIINRLRDPQDDLDIDMMSEMIQKLSEKVSGRPTM